MLIDEDDMTNDGINFGTRFSIMFVYIRARFRFELIGRNLTAQSKKWNSNSRDVVASSPSFSRLPFLSTGPSQRHQRSFPWSDWKNTDYHPPSPPPLGGTTRYPTCNRESSGKNTGQAQPQQIVWT